MMKKIKYSLIGLVLWLVTGTVIAQNPLIRDQFTADPSARVFGDRVYIYPSHDIPVIPGHGRANWFCMEDYHVFSSLNLTDWKDHGTILTQNRVPWADSTAYSMWAPDCVFRNGKYYFYFPAPPGGISKGKGFRVGVAVANKPTGPFTPQKEPIEGIQGIDPNVFIDDDGQAYIYWAQGNIYAAKLKANMLELASEPVIFDQLPEKGLKEGPYLFKRKDNYYLTYPHVANKTERLEYAMSKSPLGPFSYTGVIMDESASGCWTNHQSIIKFKNQWYLFYHNDDLSPQFDKNRSIRADSLFFNGDGTIRKVLQTLRGVGISPATSEIQIDRYSAVGNSGISVAFLDSLQKMKGWKATFSEAGAWLRYNRVAFSRGSTRWVTAKVKAARGGVLEIHADKPSGPLIARLNLGRSTEWGLQTFVLLKSLQGTHDLFFVAGNSGPVEIDWISFKQRQIKTLNQGLPKAATLK
ncbi:family 43 glycosylhydrolase [Mucilaginibacter gracilis]|nr:family 43 glycosylhydrolase [Mucilaginibacter gracilis]